MSPSSIDVVEYRDSRELPRDQVLALYEAVGWSSANKPTELMAALAGSDAVVTAWAGDRLVGLGNAITDGALVVYYPHLCVHPDYQRRGIGREIMCRLMARYAGFHQQAILAEGDAVDFYQRCGFTHPASVQAMWIYAGGDRRSDGAESFAPSFRDLLQWQRLSTQQIMALILGVTQALAFLVALIASASDVEMILSTGPALAVVGYAFALFTWPLRSWYTLAYGLSAPFVTTLIACLIAILDWGPRAAQGPVITLFAIYALYLVSLGLVAARQILRWPSTSLRHEIGANQVLHRSDGSGRREVVWQYSLKSLLLLMTGLAVLLVLGRLLVEWFGDRVQLMFGAYALLNTALCGVLLYRFLVVRRRERVDALGAES